MVDFETLSAFTQKVAFAKITEAANSPSQASPEQLSRVFAEIIVSAIHEYDLQRDN